MASSNEWILTFTGRQFYPLNPRIGDIVIEDIAHALSNICRFTGHVKTFYSVAEHSLRAAQHAPDDLKLAMLLHDASEAYLNDIARPVKHSNSFAGYRAYENVLQGLIGIVFDVDFLDPRIKEIDNRMLMTERRDLMPHHSLNWQGKWEIDNSNAYGETIVPISPLLAESRFLRIFEDLTVGVHLG